jgi:hypothetical protein
VIQSSKEIKRAPIVGFVRYSQKIAFGGKNVAKDVFEPGYFEYRFNIFKNVTLKSFQGQTKTDFVLLLLHSESMPAVYRERFSQLEENNPFLFNVFVRDTQESFDNALSDSLNFSLAKNEAIVTFRVDNDDAVPSDFIVNLSRFSDPQFIGHCISSPALYGLQHIALDTYMVEELYFPANAVGLAYVTHSSDYKTILELGDHDLVNNRNNLILLPKSENSVIMTINGQNEINKIDKLRARIFNQAELYKYLEEKNFCRMDLKCLDIVAVESSFSVKNIVKLLTPPVYWKLQQKLNRFF